MNKRLATIMAGSSVAHEKQPNKYQQTFITNRAGYKKAVPREEELKPGQKRPFKHLNMQARLADMMMRSQVEQKKKRRDIFKMKNN